jgi:hypothetical protein
MPTANHCDKAYVVDYERKLSGVVAEETGLYEKTIRGKIVAHNISGLKRGGPGRPKGVPNKVTPRRGQLARNSLTIPSIVNG